MINHGRTLLVNAPGGSRPASDFPGEEFIPTDYVPKIVVGNLGMVRQFLYGSAPDRLMLNYRTRQLISIIHGNADLEQFMFDLDPRITYWPTEDRSLFTDTFGETINQVAGLSSSLTLSGDTLEDGSNGQLTRQWLVEVLTATTVKIQQQKPTLDISTAEYSIEAGLSSLIPLPLSGLLFRFAEAGAGTTWLINSVVRPTDDLGALLASFDVAGEPLFFTLFGVSPPEPFLTFRNLFRKSDLLAYRLGGVVLALIYQTDLLPQQQAVTVS